MNSRASDFLNYFYFCKDIKEVCGKNLGRMECSLWALPVSAMIVLFWTAGLLGEQSKPHTGLFNRDFA